MTTTLEHSPESRETGGSAVIAGILAYLQDRRLQPGDRLPSERDLAELVGDELAARRIRRDLERRNRVLERFVLGSSALFVLVWAANMVFVIAS